MKSIYVYGASGHGLVVFDIALACGYEDIVFVDDAANEHPSFECIEKNNHIPIVFGIGDNEIRAKLFEKVMACGFRILSLSHPSSVISPSVTIGIGTVVMPKVVINAKANIGDGVILNSGCVIEHECTIGDFVHISPNVALSGNVEVGKFTHVGIGSCVIQGVKIGEKSIIGAGATVVSNINSFKKAYGNPCKEIEDIHR
jgi:UDP-N-acetylbacillosamine N-acetyltransferase